MAQPRTIKKYPNRRLYDTQTSRYIKLNDLKQLISDGVDFEVRDANTNDDITRTILLQIISEQENGGKPLFNTEILINMIRSYGTNSQETFTSYLTKSLQLFSEQQKAYQEKMSDMVSDAPMAAMTKRNLEIWQDVQSNFLRATGLLGSAAKEPENKDDTKQ